MSDATAEAFDRLRANTQSFGEVPRVAAAVPLPVVSEAPRAVVATSSACLADLDACLRVLHGRYRLSSREREVLRLVLLGYANDEIADELDVALRTAKTHVEHIWKKLGVTSRARLMGMLFTEAA